MGVNMWSLSIEMHWLEEENGNIGQRLHGSNRAEENVHWNSVRWTFVPTKAKKKNEVNQESQ